MRADPAARALALWRGKPLIALGPKGRAAGAFWGPVFPGADNWFFLGLDSGSPRFAVDLSALPSERGDDKAPQVVDGARFIDLRSVMAELPACDAAAAAAARSLWAWHAANRFCGRCAAPSTMEEAGWRRGCPACGAKHVPRAEPAIVLLIEREGAALLARRPDLPDGMVSLFSNFLEPGESMEAAASRAARQELGLTIGLARYVASQPWPFPGALMLGCRASAMEEDPRPNCAGPVAAFWSPRDQVAQALNGGGAPYRLPPRGAIARAMLEAWIAGDMKTA